jgi:putative DNA primase/helicase
MAGLSDWALAQRVVAEHEGNIRRVPEWGTYLIWNGRTWDRDREDAILLGLIAERLSAWGAPPDEKLIRAIKRLVPSVSGVMSCPDEWDADPYLFGWSDGIYDLRNGENLGYRKDLRVTLHSPFRPEGKCERFRGHFAWQVDGDKEAGAFLALYLGYCLTGLRREQGLVINQGPGGCGKNLFWDTISAVMGPYAGICPRGLLVKGRDDRYANNDYAVADLAGKRLMIQSETERGGYINEEMMKSVTGDRELKGRDPYAKYVTFQPQAKFVLVTNYWPNFRSLDRSMMRRIIPWTISVVKEEAEMDKDLLAKIIQEEGNGIAQALMCWARRYFETERLTLPASFTSRKEAYKTEMDEFGRFLGECAETKLDDPEYWVANKALYPLYVKWSRVNGCAVLSQKSFSAEMDRNGYGKRDTNKGNIWMGLGIREGVETELNAILNAGRDTKAEWTP